MEYTDILSPETRNTLDMKDKKQSKTVKRVQEDTSKNIHKFKYYERYGRQYLHNAPFLLSEELADYFGVKPNTVDHWVTKGWIGFSRPTNKRVFLREDINEFIKRNRHEADPK